MADYTFNYDDSHSIAGVTGKYATLKKFKPDDDRVELIMHSHGIYDRRENNAMYNKFARIPYVDPFNTTSVTREYLFFTKPDLHLFKRGTSKIADSLSSYSFFVDAIDRYPYVCMQLQSSAGASTYENKNPYITLLSNAVRSGLDIPGAEATNDLETGANVYGTKITYRGSSYTSDQDLSFSLEFEDTKYYEIYMFFKIYDEYCKYKQLGLIELDYGNNKSDDLAWINYTINKILHDQFSVYKIVVGEDGQTILWWGKYTGVYPVNVPRDSFGDMNKVENQRLSVNFKAQFFRDMDPVTLTEINRISIPTGGTYRNRATLPLFDETNHMINGEWGSVPYIVTSRTKTSDITTTTTKYKLLWKR